MKTPMSVAQKTRAANARGLDRDTLSNAKTATGLKLDAKARKEGNVATARKALALHEQASAMDTKSRAMRYGKTK